MTSFILSVFEITIGMSLFIALLLLSLKLFGGKFTAKCRYMIWALVMLRLAIPFSFGLLPTLIEIPIETEPVQSENLSSVLLENTDPVTSVQPSDPGNVVVSPTVPNTPVFPTVPIAPNADLTPPDNTPTFPGDQAAPVIPSEPVIETPTEHPISLRQILDITGIIYLIGAVAFLVWNLVSYFIYTRKILRKAKETDDRTQKIFSTICQKNGIKKQPTLLVASGIHSPSAFGIFRRKIVLPDIAFTENGLVGTLAHEVTHCKRGDLYMKLVELIACSLNWFNPLVHIAAFQCEMEMELSCDEKVLSGSSEATRAAYADVMLDIIRRCRRNRGALTTHFNPKKSAVTARFKNILYGSGKRRGRILIGVCLVLCVLAGTVVACQTGDDLPEDHWYAEGYYLKCDNGSDVIVVDADGANPASPCEMIAADEAVSFEGLTDGDRIKVEISMIMTTYPGQTDVYSIKKLSDGEMDDIDSAVLDSLRELGWIDDDNKDVDESTNIPDIPEEWHVFEYDGVKYDLWDISELVNGVSEWGHIGKYVIAEGHVNPNMCVYAVIDTEMKTMVSYFTGTVPTYHSDDLNTLVYAYRNKVVTYDGTTLASYGLEIGEYITGLSYTEDKSSIEVTIEGGQSSRTEIIILSFDAQAFFSNIPAEWSQRLFWHRIQDTTDYLYFCSYRGVNSTLDGYNPNPPKQFFIFHVNSQNKNSIGNIQAEIPSDITYDSVCPVVVMDGSGSKACEFIVQLTDGEKLFYVSFDNFAPGESEDHLTFTCRGVLPADRVNNLKAQYTDAFRKAEKYYWYYTLSDFKNKNPGNSLVYEGYTVEYECESPYAGKFDFHIHLPQLNSNAPYAEKWNYIYQQYDVEFGELLRKTVHGTNTDHFVHITYNTVTTGDVLTIYIIKAHGILASGAFTLDYDIYHYNMKTDRFLSTDAFLASYAQGQFAGYTVADIVKFMNQITVNTNEVGTPLPLTEADIIGVIPSVLGNGKFDVVYRGYSMEGYHATRMLFSAYPIYGNPHRYTYCLTYHDYVDCDDLKTYGPPVGYRLLLSQRVAGEFSTGYYVDCLFTEDLAEPPESYSLSEHGGYYTPVQQDSYGYMYMVIDHETDRGHLNAWIPFDMPDSAQDYYRGMYYGYFSYDRILHGNYEVNQNIAVQVAAILDAYRNGKDPNELLPASKTEYTPYPLETIRENPTANEVGSILKNASIGENGIINFSIDLGGGLIMSLPIAIGGFGESVQAYFVGVYFVHGTPAVQNDHMLNTERLSHQAVMANQSVLYDTLTQKEMLLSDWLKTNEMTVSKYTVLDLDSDANSETVLWLTRGSNEYVGFLILHSDAGMTYAYLLYYRQFADLKEDGTFSFSSSVANGGFGEIQFKGETCSVNKIAYCESKDNQIVSYFFENQSVTKEIYDAIITVQDQKLNAAWYNYEIK